MAECAQCMFENATGAASCEQCGADLAVEALSMQLGAVCRSCDSYNDPGVRMCVSCGAALARAEEDAAPTPIDTQPVPLAVAEAELARPWLAPPNTNPSLTPVATAPVAAPAAAAPPEPPPAAKAPAVGGLPPGALPPGALPPSALPPGWAAFQQKPAAARAPAAPAPVALAVVRCDHCRSENPQTARFCGTCGQAIVATSTAPRARGKLILIRGISGEGRQFPLQSTNTAGRHDGTLTFPDDPYVAANHATFLFRGDDLVVKDEGAGNGVYVRLREAQALKHGDVFVVGERLLRYMGPQVAQGSQPGRHGSPRLAERLIVLEELLEGGGTGRVCKRAGPIVTIGRAGCDLNFPQDGFVSARHAELSLAGETAFLRDLGSANGTFLRVPSRGEKKLAHGDYLLMGRELLRVEVSAAR